MGVEIERKFIVSNDIAKDYYKQALNGQYEYKKIEQAYLTTNPVIRVRKSNDKYYMTYKGKGFIEREEYNLPLTEEAYMTLREKADGNIISKTRVLIPYDRYTIELDIFDKPFEEITIAEVEFETLDDANSFCKPDWFLEDVTEDRRYSNSYLSRQVQACTNE